MSPLNELQVKIREVLFERIPREAEISRIEFEGPNIAVYTKRPEILIQQNYVIADIVNILHKRVVIRSDPSVRLPEKDSLKEIRRIIPDEADVTNVMFDPTVGEAIIEARKPELVIGKDGMKLEEIIESTKWMLRVLRSPPIPSKTIANIRHLMCSESKSRGEILRKVGERIFRPNIFKTTGVRVTALGGSQEVGRSAILVQTDESMVLLDCGIKPGFADPNQAYPRLNVGEFDLELIDAVVISHAHLDHSGFLPFLYKYGYDGPVYCSEPTASLMTLLQLDNLDVLNREGLPTPYDQKDVRKAVLHTIPLKYGVVTDIAPNIRLTLHNAGHILGSSIIHLHIGEGVHNIVYTGDFKFGRTMLLDPAETKFPRVETLIIESTYGSAEDVMPPRKEAEERLVSVINETIEKGGKILMPVPAVGRSQEMMLVLDRYMEQGLLKEVPVYIDGMIREATAIHTAHPEYLDKRVRGQILHQGENPFQSDYFTIVDHPEDRPSIIEGEPCVILATSGMLEGGPSVEYFKSLAPDEENSIVFVSYQIDGTLGSKVMRGAHEIQLLDSDGKIRVFKVKSRVESIVGFSGHSDRNQIIRYVGRVYPRPERVIVNHGERAKCLDVASSLRKIYKVDARAPRNLETIRLE